MSSWNNNRIHFREKKHLKPIINNPIPDAIQTESINLLPSKYINLNTHTNNIVVCAIALNEELYIDEWIKYNLALGFSHIYIYDNSNDNILNNKNSNQVTIIHFPGKTKQLEAYNMFTLKYKKIHKWCAFIDCDEFIVLKKHNTIADFLNEYQSYDSIGLNWKMFGTSNQLKYINEPVTKRFKYCSSTINEHIKSITKLSSIDIHISPHFSQLLRGYNYDTNKNIIKGPFNPLGSDDIAIIHHYYTKSEEEFVKKIERGRADIPEKRITTELINIHSKNNDILNLDAWVFYSKHL